MISAVIIDDENKVIITLTAMIEQHSIPVQLVGSATNVKQGVELIQKTQPDLIFLDVKIGQDTGFDLLKALDEIKSKVIFISAHNEYAIEAFKFSAIDYLLKPIDPQELEMAVIRAEQRVDSANVALKLNVLLSNWTNRQLNEKKIVLKTADKIHLVPVKDIIRCEAYKNYTHFFIENDKILVSKSLKEFDTLLSPYGFFRAHKSHLINISHFRKFIKRDGGFVELLNSDLVPVSTRKREALLTLIEQI